MKSSPMEDAEIPTALHKIGDETLENRELLRSEESLILFNSAEMIKKAAEK